MESSADLDLATTDLGPLAWVLDELRKSLDSASAALRRFVRDTAMARGTDMASVDGGQLRIARQQLHQAVGALEMVGLGAPAHVLRSMEAAVQKFVDRPDLCDEAGAAKVERAGFALTEYLEGLLHGKSVSALALFPQYKDTQALAGAERVHPADLWSLDWRWSDPATPAATEAFVYDPAVRSRMDQGVLKLVKTGEPEAAREIAHISLGLAATQSARQPKVFWKICAGYFEALGLGLLPQDLYVKRAASRILLQYASLAKGELGVSDRLAQDLVFFCSQAVPPAGAQCPSLDAVREAWGLARFKPVDYNTAQFGRFDPVLLSQARKRIGAAKETWSALSGGDANKLKGLQEQFNLVCDSLVKLHPPSQPLAQALTNVVESVVRSARPPGAELAMEVATAVLYLEAAFMDLDPSDPQLAVRTGRLAERLDTARQGGQPEPLEPWMEELYRRVSDRQTMGSVVGELRGTLGELEKLLDQYFRNLQDKTPLRDAPTHLAQMRGVLSVLGLDQAAQAVSRMRETVEEIIIMEIDETRARAAGTFDKLGNNLGALGFLIDMLNYQPALAKKLFVYDDTTGELSPLMGRTGTEDASPGQVPAQAAVEPEDLDRAAREAVLAMTSADPEVAASAFSRLDDAVSAMAPLDAAPAPAPAPVQAAALPLPPSDSDDIEEDDLLDIFLEEAREVVGNGLAAIETLAANPADASELTTLRRAFHTLKGSSRMVGLNEFGEAAWSMEQVLNTWLADQKPATDELRILSTDAMKGFGRWTDDIAAHNDSAWKASQFRVAADALRIENRLMSLSLPQATEQVASVQATDLAFDLPEEFSLDLPDAPVQAAGQPPAEPEIQIPEIDLPDADVPPAQEDPTISIDPLHAPVTEPGLDPLPVDMNFGETHVIRGEPAQALEIPHGELPKELAFDAARTVILRSPEPEQAPPQPMAPEMTADIEGIDFGSLAEVAGPASATPEPAQVPAIEVSFDELEDLGEEIDLSQFDAPLDLPAVEPASPLASQPEATPVQADEAVHDEATAAVADEHADLLADSFEPLEVASEIDEQVKVIGPLRIGIPLYNVYLNEADEWSRRLATEVAEWALELNQPVPDSTVGLAHALAGSSATVGFHALSDIARALEAELQHTQRLAWATPQHGRVFSEAAEEIRRLLHQFAAGFLKEPTAGVIEAMQNLRELEIPRRAEEPEDLEEESSFAPPDFQDTPVTADADNVHLSAQPQEAQPEPVAEFLPEVVHEEAPEEAPEEASEVVLEAVADEALEPAPDEALDVSAPQEPTPLAPVFSASTMAPLVERRQVMTEQDQDDFDIADAVDPDLFPIFEEEATELLPQLGGALRQWTARPENRSARDESLRALHTLKGSARLAGALRLGELAHRMESEIEYLGFETVTTSDIEPILQSFDNMQANFDALRATGGLPPAAAVEAAHDEPEEVDLSGVDAPAVQPLADDAETAPPTAVSPGAQTQAVDWAQATARSLVAKPAAMNLAPQRAASNQAVRVRSQLLDRLVNQAGEVIITRSRLEAELRQLRGSLTDLTGNLDRLRAQLRDIELQAESQMQSRLAQAKDSAAGFDPLEFDRFTRVQELTRMMAESVNDVATVQRNLQRTVESTEDDLIAQARQTRELQRDLLRTRMVEFEGISDRLYRVVRLASKETGKQVKLDITGGSIEMDRGVLDRMTPAFEHLLRNCVAHGIEDPQVRIASGKDAAGTILIGLQHEGNDVSVEFRDDGAGLDVARIREKALSQGLIAPDAQLSDQDAANLIFMPGFSTAATVTELSGRGIGMDVVRAEVNGLGGRIETATQAGKGTSFRLVLPLTTAVTQVVMIRSGKQSVGVPANLIEIVRRATPKDIEQAYNSGTYEFGGEQLPFYWSGALLQSSQRSDEPQSRTLPVVIFRSAAQRIAVHVDEVLGNQEVVVKNLGPQLARLPGLAGMTVLASGAVVLIYNPVALSTVYGEQARQMSADRAQPDMLESGGASTPVAPVVAQIPLVLVVDDSITVRRVTQRLLQREGYRVALAADGLQALERLADEKPTVVLSDIEMPRMDGFDLARNIRGDARLKDLPIIMITSRIAEKHREHAKELGVDHYLGKPYSEEELLSLVKHYSTAASLA
ncbi:response regulator [Caenimonas koreensis DSM 17982]|uniref:Chemotaxis protein CheA n=1 Tax=Caenimonas koreensis DSM 17982 TaxID=1121255 RepID=A0A844B546_9BURK|nr:Hpt domain-containing protein [Caenimonas koreensis]MRD48332.1 response regulator [Caenimonas koreensis DSM 17982]